MKDSDQPTTAKSLSRCLGGRFVLTDHVRTGGGAVVVRARDQRLPRLVAIKLLRSTSADARRRFIQEGDLLANIDHPGIVKVLDRGADGDDLYMALELIDGPDLSEHACSGPMPWRDVIEVGIQVASALEAVHCKGLVHRDVKPANIMLADPGPPLRVKLVDFGIARITENYRAPSGSTPRRATSTGTALGTPGYQPLEAGLVPANPLFDVFGLGATLFELLTGHLPGPFQSPLDVFPDCDAPADLGLVLAAAMALEPQDRTQTAAELGRALAAVRTAHPDRSEPAERIEGRYELIGLVGTGANGESFLATHRGAGHDVVLKFLKSKASADDHLRFAREARLLRTFNHPGLPRFYDFSPRAEAPYIVMAHAPGRPALQLVPAPTSDWTPHPVPDTSPEQKTPSFAPAGPRVQRPANASAWRPRPWQAAVSMGAVTVGAVCGLLMAGQRTEREPVPRVSARLDTVIAPQTAPTEPKLQASLPTSPAPPLLPVYAALDAATAALRGCSALAGGLLIVEFESLQGANRFGSVVVSGSSTPALDRCVSLATADIRFQPQGSHNFTKEYTP